MWILKLLRCISSIRTPPSSSTTHHAVTRCCSLQTAINHSSSPLYQNLLPVVAFSLLFKSKEDPPTAESITETLFSEAVWMINKHQYDKAERILQNLLIHLENEEELNPDLFNSKSARVYSELANLNLLMGRHSKAEQFFKQTIQLCLNSGLQLDDAVIVELSLKLALIYVEQNRMEEAETGFLFCISSQQNKEKKMDSDETENEQTLLAMCHNCYSDFLFSRGIVDLALVHAKAAYNLSDRLYPPTHPNRLNLQCNMVVMMIELGLYSEARSHIQTTRDLIQDKLIDNEDDTESKGTCYKFLVHLLLHLVELELIEENQSAVSSVVNEIETYLPLADESEQLRSRMNDCLKKSIS